MCKEQQYSLHNEFTVELVALFPCMPEISKSHLGTEGR